MSLLRISLALAVLAAFAAGGASAPAQTASGAAAEITASGVGKVKLGKKYATLRRQGLVGKIRRGCELAPNTRSASLKAPLKGTVDFSRTSARKVTNITIRGGATARGVGIGGTLADIKAAYPTAREDHGSDDVFGVTLVTVPKSDGGRIQFAVSTTTGRIEVIGVPFIAFCE